MNPLAHGKWSLFSYHTGGTETNMIHSYLSLRDQRGPGVGKVLVLRIVLIRVAGRCTRSGVIEQSVILVARSEMNVRLRIRQDEHMQSTTSTKQEPEIRTGRKIHLDNRSSHLIGVLRSECTERV